MSDKIFDLTGKVAVITGSTKGIGKAIAEQMSRAGAKVVISSRKAGPCDDVAAEINAAGGEAVAIPCHIGDKDQCKNLIDSTIEKWGKIDILVCNAAVNPYYGSMSDIPDDLFDKTMSTNIKSNAWLATMAAPQMRARKDGVIIITSSIGGLIGDANIGVYSISKAADMQLARNLAVEWGPDNIRVNCIAPGLVRTDMAKALWENPDIYKRVTSSAPLRRIGEPNEIAGAAVYLASSAGSFTTGQTMVIDGGVTIAGSPPVE
ncbi:MAG: glucose 1-dehydrogenase [Alphaproteobacteria bacterium]|jgi:NAD(P)-dependent dehydrogenase (short-subunit alcohol dehydrogenase family)|nr:glucose 1-dehydrogenase [Alphaproteobacteria bacterium]MBT4019462.1 glucose 1-dehydrogenase [Alphaproteobacteria bacterium]MBT4967284.1 glucose 1-dehydrogenase [Alphaproteobacteria bacterium]MBT5160473.1 glucose 1-dehydrogenase [Alphaproteobacteria bacterium]MBT5919480.1 glucose 1-dehydrogenase [Alphaproteobacteria bacterium]